MVSSVLGTMETSCGNYGNEGTRVDLDFKITFEDLWRSMLATW